jgi:hypothetical protein
MSTHENATDDTTDFGFERVKTEEKAGRVREVFRLCRLSLRSHE